MHINIVIRNWSTFHLQPGQWSLDAYWPTNTISKGAEVSVGYATRLLVGQDTKRGQQGNQLSHGSYNASQSLYLNGGSLVWWLAVLAATRRLWFSRHVPLTDHLSLSTDP
jgi:hypothetical protein